MNAPIAILLFEQTHDATTFYTFVAYSPKEYDTSTYTAKNVNSFMDRVYAEIGYNVDTPLNNKTKHGLLLEVHTRFLSIPLHERKSPKIYFSTIDHPHCKYKPIHPTNPIFFRESEADAEEYDVVSAPHEFV